MGLGPIAGIDSISLPTAGKTEQAVPRFEIDASERAGDEPRSSRQQASERERKQEAGDQFQPTAGEENEAAETISQTSEEDHDWFV